MRDDNRRQGLDSRVMTGAKLLALVLTAGIVSFAPAGPRPGLAFTPRPMVSLPPTAVPRFAYVANGGDNTLSIYTVNATTGQLRSNGYVTTGSNPIGVTVDPTGQFVYVANGDSNDISAYAINPN